jgi:hypothetical protein
MARSTSRRSKRKIRARFCAVPILAIAASRVALDSSSPFSVRRILKALFAMTMPNDNGIFWRSEVLSRLDRALDSCGAAREAGRRDPKGLRAAADYCRKVASGLDAAVAANLYAVAGDLEAEALRNEVFMRSDCSSKTVLTD